MDSRYCTSAIACILMTSCLSACGNQGPVYKTLTAHAVDLGSVPVENETIQTRIRFENAGDEPLRIVRIATDCSCTTMEWDEAQMYQPGEEGGFTVLVDVGDELSVSKSILVYTNARTTEAVSYRISARPKRDLRWWPKSMDFRMTGRAAATREVYLRSASPGFLVKSVVSKSGRNYAVSHIYEEDQAIIRVTTEGDGLKGVIHDILEIKTDSTSTPTIEIPVRISNIGLVRSDPRFFHIEQRETGLTSRLTIRSADGSLIDIDEILSPDPVFEVTASAMPAKEVILTLGSRVASLGELDPQLRNTVVSLKMESVTVEIPIVF